MVVADLFMAGMVTTSITLSWALLLMILHPDVQRESGWGWEERRRRAEVHALSLLRTLVALQQGMTAIFLPWTPWGGAS